MKSHGLARQLTFKNKICFHGERGEFLANVLRFANLKALFHFLYKAL